jgi:hypothetical protein
MNLDARPYRPRRSLVLYATYTYRRSSYPTPVVLHTVVVLEVVPSGTSVRFAAHVRARDAVRVSLKNNHVYIIKGKAAHTATRDTRLSHFRERHFRICYFETREIRLTIRPHTRYINPSMHIIYI